MLRGNRPARDFVAGKSCCLSHRFYKSISMTNMCCMVIGGFTYSHICISAEDYLFNI